jgi:hypothetical protein
MPFRRMKRDDWPNGQSGRSKRRPYDKHRRCPYRERRPNAQSVTP